MVKWVRSGVMEGAPELVAELGGDYRALAREAGVPAAPMANPDLPMRVDRFVVFMELAAARLGEPAFGLKLGPRQTLSLFGPMAPLLGSAATVRDMILDLADFFPLHTQGTIVGLEPIEGGLLLNYELSAEVGSQQRHPHLTRALVDVERIGRLVFVLADGRDAKGLELLRRRIDPRHPSGSS